VKYVCCIDALCVVVHWSVGGESCQTILRGVSIHVTRPTVAHVSDVFITYSLFINMFHPLVAIIIMVE
jgi:hypothetical protein